MKKTLLRLTLALLLAVSSAWGCGSEKSLRMCLFLFTIWQWKLRFFLRRLYCQTDDGHTTWML